MWIRGHREKVLRRYKTAVDSRLQHAIWHWQITVAETAVSAYSTAQGKLKANKKRPSCFKRVEIYNCQYTYNWPCNSVLSSLFTVRGNTLFCLMPKLTVGWAMKPEELSASCLCPFVTSHRAVCLRPYSLKVKVAMAEIIKCCQWGFSGLWNVLNIGLRSCRPLLIPQCVHWQSYTFWINWNLSNSKLGNFRVICPFSFIGFTPLVLMVACGAI